MSEKYTPEPWVFANIPDSDLGMVEIYNKPWGIGIVGYAITIEDAKRITDCVNACKEMKDPADYIAELRQQRDEAVKLLEYIIDDPRESDYEDIRIFLASNRSHL